MQYTGCIIVTDMPVTVSGGDTDKTRHGEIAVGPHGHGMGTVGQSACVVIVEGITRLLVAGAIVFLDDPVALTAAPVYKIPSYDNGASRRIEGEPKCVGPPVVGENALPGAGPGWRILVDDAPGMRLADDTV